MYGHAVEEARMSGDLGAKLGVLSAAKHQYLAAGV